MTSILSIEAFPLNLAPLKFIGYSKIFLQGLTPGCTIDYFVANRKIGQIEHGVYNFI